MQAIVTATASGGGTPIATAPRVRSTSGTWSAAPALTGLVQYAYFGTTLGAVVNDSSTAKTTSLVPDATMMAGAQVISVWPAQSQGFAVDGSAASLGMKTTASVVKSIFLVIILDGVFAMFFATIGM